MFESLLSETMKEHQYENEELQMHFFETEQKTKHLLEADSNEITEDNFLNVEEFNKILNCTSKSCLGPYKISYQLLKALPKNIKLFICIIISGSINNSYVLRTMRLERLTSNNASKTSKRQDESRKFQTN